MTDRYEDTKPESDSQNKPYVDPAVLYREISNGKDKHKHTQQDQTQSESIASKFFMAGPNGAPHPRANGDKPDCPKEKSATASLQPHANSERPNRPIENAGTITCADGTHTVPRAGAAAAPTDQLAGTIKSGDQTYTVPAAPKPKS